MSYLLQDRELGQVLRGVVLALLVLGVIASFAKLPGLWLSVAAAGMVWQVAVLCRRAAALRKR